MLKVGKTFSISVLPKYISQDELNNISASEFTFNVVDGYNVYNAADLSLFDNVNASGKWTKYKNVNGIALDLNISALILQNNITIEREDIPSSHYWTASEVSGATDYNRVVNSLKDSKQDDLGIITSQTSINYQPSAEAFSNAKDYMNIYLNNGMSVVIGIN